ncbi:MAG: tetratricopeptide repeat protein [Alphaproteobacteria bacterium]|nr:MAG: tetratricopeptide repeat protein [Alphaproteobacteria bacterium]
MFLFWNLCGAAASTVPSSVSSCSFACLQFYGAQGPAPTAQMRYESLLGCYARKYFSAMHSEAELYLSSGEALGLTPFEAVKSQYKWAKETYEKKNGRMTVGIDPRLIELFHMPDATDEMKAFASDKMPEGYISHAILDFVKGLFENAGDIGKLKDFCISRFPKILSMSRERLEYMFSNRQLAQQFAQMQSKDSFVEFKTQEHATVGVFDTLFCQYICFSGFHDQDAPNFARGIFGLSQVKGTPTLWANFFREYAEMQGDVLALAAQADSCTDPDKVLSLREEVVRKLMTQPVKSSQDTETLLKCLYKLGNEYIARRNFAKAAKYYELYLKEYSVPPLSLVSSSEEVGVIQKFCVYANLLNNLRDTREFEKFERYCAQALDELEGKAIYFYNSVARIFMLKSSVHVLKGENVQAAEAAQKSVEYSSHTTDKALSQMANLHLAQAYTQNGRFDEAREILLRKCPQTAETLEECGRVNFMSGRYNCAFRAWESALTKEGSSETKARIRYYLLPMAHMHTHLQRFEAFDVIQDQEDVSDSDHDAASHISDADQEAIDELYDDMVQDDAQSDLSAVSDDEGVEVALSWKEKVQLIRAKKERWKEENKRKIADCYKPSKPKTVSQKTYNAIRLIFGNADEAIGYLTFQQFSDLLKVLSDNCVQTGWFKGEKNTFVIRHKDKPDVFITRPLHPKHGKDGKSEAEKLRFNDRYEKKLMRNLLIDAGFYGPESCVVETGAAAASLVSGDDQ